MRTRAMVNSAAWVMIASAVSVAHADGMPSAPVGPAAAAPGSVSSGAVQTQRGRIVATSVTVDRNSIGVAQRETVTVTVDVLRGCWARFQEIGHGATAVGDLGAPVGGGGAKSAGSKADRKLGEWRVVSVSDDAPALTPTGTRLVRRIVLEPFLAGVYTVPEMEIGYGGAGVPEGVVRTTPLQVNVTTLLDDASAATAKLGDPRDLVTLGAPTRRHWTTLVTAAAGLAAAALVLVALTRRRAGPDEYERAIARLAGIAAASAGDPIEACDAVAACTRQAIAARIDPRAVGMTSAELVAAAPSWATFGVGEVRELDQILLACDAARYSGGPAPDGTALVDRAIRLLTPMRTLPPIRATPLGAGRPEVMTDAAAGVPA